MKRRAGLLAGVLVGLAALVAGCGSGATAQGTAGERVAVIDLPSLGADLAGLAVEKEDVAGTVARVDSAFIDGFGLYSLRADDLVQATLQVSRFNEEARPEEARFRQMVVNQIGSSRPRAFRLGTQTVYLTTGTRQSIAVWFKDRYMFVLASRADYDQPRTLLRKALEFDV